MFNLPEKEQEILKLWQEKNIFKKTLDKESPRGDFVFYDGPPFATGLPHYGHIVASLMKDIVPRYWTMKGFCVERRWGWDCHGLPIENIVEEEMSVKSKKDIEKIGIDKFNAACRSKVLMYAGEWRKVVERMGRWVDMDNDYKTMDRDYMESIWWVFKELWHEDLIYEGYKSMHVCPRCETTLSQSEVAEGYRDAKDVSVTVKFELVDEPGTFVLAWTTTPWTLMGNVALAIGEKISYVLVENKENKEKYILAKDLVEKIFKDRSFTPKGVQDDIRGKDLVGKKYKPLFDYYLNKNLENKENLYTIQSADFVTTEDGTGVVHIAPAFGEDDLNLGRTKNLPFIQHVGMDGRIKDEVKDFVGLEVKLKDDPVATDRKVIEFLQNKNLVFATEEYIHSYPFCWRCDSPLLNYATGSLFVKVEKIKEQALKTAKKINWVPPHLKEGRFGQWLEGARDWSISRQRFWGSVIPLWVCEKCGEKKVIGSYDELPVFKNLKNQYYLLRHGEAENNVKDILCGVIENDHYYLTENGKKQIENLMQYFKNEGINVVIHSPFIRTTETATLVVQSLGLEVTEKNDLLSEVKMGVAEGKNDDWVEANIGNLETRLKTGWPEGESIADLRQRAEKFLRETENKYDNKKILLVSHGDTIAALMAVALGKTDLEAWHNNYPEIASLQKFSQMFQATDQKFFDPHRPFIDEIILQCDKCGGKMRRVPEVMDCWFESGSMPYAQMHYPFENKEKFEANFPAEFIAEGVDQTRTWFYYTHILANGLLKTNAFKNVIANGIVLAEDGKKMSKRLRNYPDPMALMEKSGADAMRYYLCASQVMKADNLCFSEKEMKEQTGFFHTLFNVLSFYKIYENQFSGIKLLQADTKPKNTLDKWILARLYETIKKMTEKLDAYDLHAVRELPFFINDLSTWYLRRSRDRFKSSDMKDKNQAIFTLGKVLFELSKLLAPFTPFTAEYVYQELGKNCGSLKESVHLENWPMAVDEMIDQKVLDYMAMTRKIVELGLAKRAEAGIKVRQPLAKSKISAKGGSASGGKNQKSKLEDEYLNLIKDELNVKEVIFEAGDGDLSVEFDTNINDELKEEGILRELVRAINNLRKEMKLTIQNKIILEWQTDDALLSQVFNKFSEELKKFVLAEKISKTEEKLEKVKINEVEIGLKIIFV